MSNPGDIWRSQCGRMELRCGDWREVLADVEQCDAVITDPPYSERTVAGQRSGNGASALAKGRHRSVNDMTYEAVGVHDIQDLCSRAVGLDPAWFFCFGDHVLVRWVETIMTAWPHEWVTHQPIPWCKPNGIPKLNGDGPACSVEWAVVSRPRRKWPARFRPGFYIHDQDKVTLIRIGCKPLGLMREIVRDYSEPGNLICDPFAGSGTTLLAAAIEGRRAIGAELDPKTFDLAVKRLSEGYTPRMQMPARAKPKQLEIDTEPKRDHKAGVLDALARFNQKQHRSNR